MTIVRTPAADTASRPRKSTRKASRRRGWTFYVLAGVAALTVLCSSLTAYYYVVFSRMIDARLSGELQRADPRIFARPFSVQRGERLSLAQMIDRLNELGYTERAPAEHPGEFAIGRNALAVIPRGGDHAGRTVRFVFSPPPRRVARARAVSDSSITSGGNLIDIQVIADHSAVAKSPSAKPPGIT
ncbi:MAG: hypothetical protein ACRD1V_14045, partial [Vicinamibacterales bacterium]